MQTEQIVALLVVERDRLSRAIEALQRSSPAPGSSASNSIDQWRGECCDSKVHAEETEDQRGWSEGDCGRSKASVGSDQGCKGKIAGLMKVSEKSLELNIGAEVLSVIRNDWDMPKAYLRGLTQREEKQEGVDFFR